jgi:heat shock protein HslJ/uncharacterized membrane protein
MRKLAFLGFLLIAITACKNQKNLTEKKNDTNTTEKPSYNQDVNTRIVYFKATGNEPFWGLEIAEDGIEFKSLTELETFKAPHIEPIRAMDANVKMYRLKTEAGEMNIQIIQGKCENSMSGDVLPYSVTVEIKRGTDQEFTTFKGCGQYITDYRLHDIWVLEQLNGKKVSPTDFSKELPRVEIYASTNKILGFAGCNQMNGSIFFEKGLLRFSNIATTRMMCEPQNKENEFLKALQSTTTYKLENNRLWLSNPSGLLLVLRKVD